MAEHDVPVIREINGYITADIAADIAGCTEINIRKMVMRGLIKAVRWGDKTLMIDRVSLETYKAGQPHSGRPPKIK
jgi:hypothetical protein